MQTAIRPFAAMLLLVALGATGPATVTVQPSNISFRSALAACPAGTLGAISFTLGHLRMVAAAGVDSDLDAANPSAQTVTFSGGGKSATATANAAKNTVTAEHVTLASARRVACVAPG
jgi:hypothetical protein